MPFMLLNYVKIFHVYLYHALNIVYVRKIKT